MNDPGFTVLFGLAPFVMVVVMIMFGVFRRNRTCPDCGAALPWLVSPWRKTRRQWLEGGWICPDCGIDVDVRGRRVESPSMLP